MSSNWDKIEDVETLVQEKTFVIQQIEFNNELIDENNSNINVLTQIINHQGEYEWLKETWYEIEEKEKKKRKEEEIKWLEIHTKAEREVMKAQERFHKEQILLM